MTAGRVRPGLAAAVSYLAWLLAEEPRPVAALSLGGAAPDEGLSGAALAWGASLALSVLAGLALRAAAQVRVERRLGARPARVVLDLQGARAERGGPPLPIALDARVALAGSAAALGFAALVGIAAAAAVHLPALDPVVPRWLARATQLQLALAALQLAPALPFDGGRVARGLLWRALGARRATRAVTAAGLATAGALLVVALSLGRLPLLLAAALLIGGALGERGTAALRGSLRGQRVGDVVDRAAPGVDALASLDDAAEALRRARRGSALVLLCGRAIGALGLDEVRRVPPGRRAELLALEATACGGSTCGEDDDLAEVAAKMAHGGRRRLAVVDAGGRAVGVVTREDLDRAIDAADLSLG